MKLKLDRRQTPFNLETSLCCGQLFRWDKIGDWWYGVVNQKILKIRQKDNVIEFEGADTDFVESYFRLDDDLPGIIATICKDPLMKYVTEAFSGLRIARQEPWECLVSYMCATYKNIPAIRKMIFELSKQFGNRIFLDGHEFFTFPPPNVYVNASLSELRKCQLGFRAERIQKAARTVTSGRIDFKTLKRLDYDKARNELLKIPGVGNKVADCVLLFSLEKLEAFPIDVWMQRIVQRYYALHFDPKLIKRLLERTSMSSKVYSKIGMFARKYFGEYAGYAQEYLFHFARNTRLEIQLD